MIEALSRLFRFTGPLPNLRPRCNVSPTQQVPIVRRTPDNGERELAQVRWGLIPFWAKDAKIGYSLINARAEGIDAKPSFREALKRGRLGPRARTGGSPLVTMACDVSVSPFPIPHDLGS